MGGHSQCFGEDFEYQKPFSCKIQGFEMLRLSFIENYHMEFIVFLSYISFSSRPSICYLNQFFEAICCLNQLFEVYDV